jgi:phage terminase large subunit GpA-like protein
MVTIAGKEWSRLAAEWRRCGKSAVKRRAFVNTVLAESWEERGEAPPLEELALRREDLPRGVVPEGAAMLTAGADLQQNRVEVYVWAWSATCECWPVDHHVVTRDHPDYWAEVSALLNLTYPSEAGGDMGITRLAFDAGNETELVRGWQARHPDRRVMLVKGSANRNAPLLGAYPRGGSFPLVWEAGVNQAKHVLYDALRLPVPAQDEPHPPGFVHLPLWWTEEHLAQLTAEVFDTTPDTRGFPKNRWTNPHQRRNEALDCHVYARIAAEPELARGVRAAGRKSGAAPGPRPQQQTRGGGWIPRTGPDWFKPRRAR